MVFVLVIGTGSSNNYAAGYNKTLAATNTSTSLVSIPKAKQDTFSVIGTISSLVITVPPAKSDSAADIGFNITNAFKVILTGEWNLSVHKGNVTNFAANFLASPMDGSKPHIHQITNFKRDTAARQQQQQMVQLATDNSLLINGTVDVKINGVVVRHKAHVSIHILKGNTIAIRLNDKDTEDHFGAQPVLGIVTRLFI
jgi:regulator of extracellular matrix RemA (YlzA/DUF370 family)